MVMTGSVPYMGDMAADIAVLLASNFKRLRIRHAGTQERFRELTGLSQPQISDLENAKGWAQLRKVGERLERAGIDPAELLLRTHSDEDEEVLSLLHAADETTRKAIIQVVRAVAGEAQRARG